MVAWGEESQEKDSTNVGKSKLSGVFSISVLDWCDDIDFGSDFLKMGGVEFLHRFIDSEHSGFRWRILDIMATILQNNQWAQDEAREKVW